MFLDEARLAARIRHPNVVPTIDISDTQDAGYYLVMDYIEGDHLGALLQKAYKLGARLPAPIALRVIVDALEGLAAAHELTDESGRRINLVHRDVSPHNIMVSTDGIARITDFGVAKAEVRLSTTRQGQFKGKLAYMAPEHASTGEADQRSDLFSAGDHPVGVPDRATPVPRREPGRDAQQDLHRADPDALGGRPGARVVRPRARTRAGARSGAALPDRRGVRRSDRGARRYARRPRQPARGREAGARVRGREDRARPRADPQRDRRDQRHRRRMPQMPQMPQMRTMPRARSPDAGRRRDAAADRRCPSPRRTQSRLHPGATGRCGCSD